MAIKTNIHHRRYTRPDQIFIVKKNSKLLQYMIDIWPERSRSEIKSYLVHKQIEINDKVETNFDFTIKAGDKFTWKSVGEKKQNPNHIVKIIYEDNDVIVVDKKPGVLTKSNEKRNEQTAFSVMLEHVHRHGKNNKIFIVHILERDSSGLLLFAKSENVQQFLLNNWDKNKIRQTYLGVVEGDIIDNEGQIISWITEDAKSLKMLSSPIDNGGRKSVTNYHVINRNGKYTLLELDLETKTKNQIRVQLSSIGHPIAGDKRYGAKTNPLGRLCLHAKTISFIHPVSLDLMEFDTDIPSYFR